VPGIPTDEGVEAKMTASVDVLTEHLAKGNYVYGRSPFVMSPVEVVGFYGYSSAHGKPIL
jgi:hypothetical protein